MGPRRPPPQPKFPVDTPGPRPEVGGGGGVSEAPFTAKTSPLFDVAPIGAFFCTRASPINWETDFYPVRVLGGIVLAL